MTRAGWRGPGSFPGPLELTPRGVCPQDPLLRVQEALNGTEVSLQHLTALVDCRSLHLVRGLGGLRGPGPSPAGGQPPGEGGPGCRERGRVAGISVSPCLPVSPGPCGPCRLSPAASGLRAGLDRLLLRRRRGPHLPGALLLRHSAHVQLHRLQRPAHLAAETVRGSELPQATAHRTGTGVSSPLNTASLGGDREAGVS